MRIDSDIRLFLNAASQHLVAAKILQREQEFKVAIYLAGYTAECCLKALILSHIPSQQRPGFIGRTFRGRHGHDLHFLAYGIENLSVPRSLQNDLKRIASWSTELRYIARRATAAEAGQFIASVEAVRAWVERSL